MDSTKQGSTDENQTSKQPNKKSTTSMDPAMNRNKHKTKPKEKRGGGGDDGGKKGSSSSSSKGKKKKKKKEPPPPPIHTKKDSTGGSGDNNGANGTNGKNKKQSGDINDVVEPSPPSSSTASSIQSSSTTAKGKKKKKKKIGGATTDTGGDGGGGTGRTQQGDDQQIHHRKKGMKGNETRKSKNRNKGRIMDKDSCNNGNTKSDHKNNTKNDHQNNKHNKHNQNCTITTNTNDKNNKNNKSNRTNTNDKHSNQQNTNKPNHTTNNHNHKHPTKPKKHKDNPSSTEPNTNVNPKPNHQHQHQKHKSSSSKKKPIYPTHHTLRQCLNRIATNDTRLIQGKLNVQPGGKTAFVTCDRGSLTRDVFVDGEKGRNRGLNGDVVFVEIIGFVGDNEDEDGGDGGNGVMEAGKKVNGNGKMVKDEKMVVLADLMRDIDIKKETQQLTTTTTTTTRDTSDGGVMATNGNVGGEESVLVEGDEPYQNDVQYDDYEISEDESSSSSSSEEEEEEEDIIDDHQFVTNNVPYGTYEVSDEIHTNIHSENDGTEKNKSMESHDDGEEEEDEMWQDDQIQTSLWNPLVNTRKPSLLSKLPLINTKNKNGQPIGKVVHVLPPKRFASDIITTSDQKQRHETKKPPRKTIVGTLTSLPGTNNCRLLLTPSDRSLPRFMTPSGTKTKLAKDEHEQSDGSNTTEKPDNNLYRAEYIYGSWSPTDKWPPCTNVRPMGNAGNVEDETMALLAEFGIFHGPFLPQSLKDVEDVVESGRTQTADGDMGWAPTPEMLVGRRDFRSHRIFTIDPTSAKDLDDALHVRNLGDGRVEIGVHIADCSYFVKAGSSVDMEARERGTTVYLVDRTIPMLPRPLCEIACSLNENVERLAFSCVWTMNMDGNLKDDKKENREEVWYGRSVIRSCARLDYATAQNIIDGKVANGEANRGEDIDEAYWPVARRPTGGHTIDGVAEDVRLMHKVAMARRKLRFEHGALALNGVKLAFQLGDDGETPEMCSPYPIRDSNRLIEEYMLLANFLVAQRIISHAKSIAQLRRHPPPKMSGIQQAVDVAKAAGFHIDTTSSRTLQKSLNKLEKECTDTLVIQCVTAMLTIPMQPAKYFVGGSVKEEDWCHFALNIPYYTHFTSPIRRYPDIIVHRVLQATIDGQDAVKSFVHSEQEIGALSKHCNTKKETSRKAQERSDIVFLSIYLKTHPIHSTCAVVTSIGTKTFTVFVPSLGLNKKIFLEDHSEKYNVTVNEGPNDNNSIILYSKAGASESSRIDINIFSKIAVSCKCKDTAPIDVSLRIVGPWLDA